jgi:predicted alpha/beta-fold hydrolase
MIHKLADRIESIHTGYRPTIWCYGAAINTAVLAMIQKVLPHNYHRELLKTQDGGLLALDWANMTSYANKMIVLVLPGLTGSSKENYVSHLIEKAGKILPDSKRFYKLKLILTQKLNLVARLLL